MVGLDSGVTIYSVIIVYIVVIGGYRGYTVGGDSGVASYSVIIVYIVVIVSDRAHT